MDRRQIPVLGIDLGGTKISAALVSDHKLQGESRRVPTPSGPQKIIDSLIELINDFKQDHLIMGVGIATAGIVNTETGEVVGSTGNLPGWEGTAIKRIIENATALRVHVENDANAAAYGEFHAGNMHDKKCMLAVTLGTGIGTGIVIDGKLYRGAHYAGGECGHIKISMENKRRCTCELWDCWEAYGSGRGLLATGWEVLDGITEEQTPLVAKREKLKNEDILDAAQQGDVIAKKALSIWHQHVACGLATLCHTLDPDAIVLSGGMSKFVDYTQLRELVADRTLPRIAERLDIRPALLGTAAGMVGAAELALDDCLADERVKA